MEVPYEEVSNVSKEGSGPKEQGSEDEEIVPSSQGEEGPSTCKEHQKVASHEDEEVDEQTVCKEGIPSNSDSAQEEGGKKEDEVVSRVSREGSPSNSDSPEEENRNVARKRLHFECELGKKKAFLGKLNLRHLQLINSQEQMDGPQGGQDVRTTESEKESEGNETISLSSDEGGVMRRSKRRKRSIWKSHLSQYTPSQLKRKRKRRHTSGKLLFYVCIVVVAFHLLLAIYTFYLTVFASFDRSCEGRSANP